MQPIRTAVTSPINAHLPPHLREVCATEGISAITTNAHASEVASCTFDEQRRVLDVTLDEVGDRVPVVCGVYAEGSIEGARIAKQAAAVEDRAVADRHLLGGREQLFQPVDQVQQIHGGLPVLRPGELLRDRLVHDPAAVGRRAGPGVEPLPADHPLASLPNVTLSAHSAFRTPEASDNLIGAALASVAGIMYLLYYGVVDFFMGFVAGIKAFTAAVLGGIGSLPGAMLGGLLIGLIEVFWAGYFSSEYKDVAVFSILVLVLIFRPTGILGKPEIEKV